ncbi:NAD(P)/FAD-dependent oxidoreductase [Streptacidiphilus melanogenes]|uniref:NAD(P)/FAD-dependent oxidoreductase n=1 Tax=Streptacidiphilus melanogenes TaxID=411235 RepID=UPI0006932436|nr:FAD-dependent oxidoreductase [Streptacidiphilus melanogenes]
MSGETAGRWGRAVVVGGGFAGLVAARVLADRFDEVTVLEQDQVTPETGVHPHAPQGWHAHALLAKGAEVLERLFPGLRAELREQGAPVYDYGERVSFLLPTGYAPRARTGVLIQSFTRDLLERGIRRRVLTLPQVRSVAPVRCEQLTAGPDGRVTGVRYRVLGDEGAGAGAAAGAELVELEADLVVDASGRSGRLEDRLRAFGVHAPAPRVLDARITYTTVHLPRPDGLDYDVAYQMTFAPGIPRGGVLLAVEHGRWTCSLFGYGDQTPPTDPEGYLDFAHSLGNPHLGEQLADRAGGEPVHRYTNVNSRWFQYHRSHDWPERLVSLGDAVCVFDPVYGQGLTVAALEADLLRRMLAERRDAGKGLDGLARRYQRGVARVVLAPWTVSGNSDLMWDPEHRPLGARIAHAYNRRLFAAAVHDPAVWARFARVVNMVASPATLFHPSVLAKVLRPGADRRAASTLPAGTPHPAPAQAGAQSVSAGQAGADASD